jgi:peptidylprolyl isomerase
MKTAYIFMIGVLVVSGILFMTSDNTKITGNVVKETGGDSEDKKVKLETTKGESVENYEGDSDDKKVKLETTKGDIIILLDSNMPITSGNFEKLVSDGFYDGVIFHRVINGFMIQGGDPKGDGTGGPGYTIEDEFMGDNKNDRGTISMANAGPNTGGSQFFINLVNNNFLDGKHPVFGKVIKGMEIIDEIAKVQTGMGDRPIEEVKILSAKLI